MKSKQPSKKAILVLALGLLVTALANLADYYLPLADFARGALMGIGIGLELTGMLLLIKTKVEDTNQAQ
jgi:hypothetical protein